MEVLSPVLSVGLLLWAVEMAVAMNCFKRMLQYMCAVFCMLEPNRNLRDDSDISVELETCV